MNKFWIQLLRFRMGRQTFFSLLALTMAGISISFAIYSISFMVRNTRAAFEIGSYEVAEQKFDIKGFEALKLK